MHLQALAERFCAASLPETVCADLCATHQGPGRTGTNLLTVEEAHEVLGHVLADGRGPLLTAAQRLEFEGMAKGLIKFLNDNCNPHCSIRIDNSGAELVSGECAFHTEEFWRD